MSEPKRRRIRVPSHSPTVPSGHTTISVHNAITMARAVLDTAPAPLPRELRRALSAVVYRCAVVPEAYDNPEWLALRDQVLAPGTDQLLDLFGEVLPQIASLAATAPSPVTDQALTELGHLVDHLLASAHNRPVAATEFRLYLETVRGILKRVLDQAP